MKFILMLQLELVLLKLSNTDYETFSVVIVLLLLLLSLSEFFIVYIFTKHYFVNYVLFLYLLFLNFTEQFLNKQNHGLHSKHFYEKVLLRSSYLTNIGYACR